MVEDNEGDIILTMEAFNASVFIPDFTVCRNGEKAYNHLKSVLNNELPFPDLVLIDINIPRINGIELLQFIRSNKEFQHIPVFILSGSSSLKEIKMCYFLKANGYLLKPVNDEGYKMMIASISWIYAAENHSFLESLKNPKPHKFINRTFISKS